MMGNKVALDEIEKKVDRIDRLRADCKESDELVFTKEVAVQIAQLREEAFSAIEALNKAMVEAMQYERDAKNKEADRQNGDQ